MQLSRIAREPVRVTLSGTLENGLPLASANVTGVTFSVLAVATTPGATTVWQPPSAYANLVANLVLAGPAAPPTGAVAVPATGGNLWMLVSDGTNSKPVLIERINVT